MTIELKKVKIIYIIFYKSISKGCFKIMGKFVINKYEEAKWIKTWNDIDEECKNCCIFPVCFGGGCALMTYRNKYLGEKKKKNCMFEKSALSTILQLLDKEKHFTVVY